MAESVEKLNSMMDEEDMEGFYNLLQEVSPVAEELYATSIGETLLAQLDKDPRAVIAEGFDFISRLCYKNTFIIKFETYIAKHGSMTGEINDPYLEDGMYHYGYMYSSASKFVDDFLKYNNYLKKHLKYINIKVEDEDNVTYIYEDESGKTYTWNYILIPSWSVYSAYLSCNAETVK